MKATMMFPHVLAKLLKKPVVVNQQTAWQLDTAELEAVQTQASVLTAPSVELRVSHLLCRWNLFRFLRPGMSLISPKTSTSNTHGTHKYGTYGLYSLTSYHISLYRDSH